MEHTTAEVQRYLHELGGEAPSEPVVRALLERSAARLQSVGIGGLDDLRLLGPVGAVRLHLAGMNLGNSHAGTGGFLVFALPDVIRIRVTEPFAPRGRLIRSTGRGPDQKDMFEQPEGIAFFPDGTLYISSEGGDGPAMLYEFVDGGTN
mgnify:CR=1 FL=1